MQTILNPNVTLYLDDCMKVMQLMADNSVETIVTDIPFGECNKVDGGLRKISKDEANITTFDLKTFIDDCIRISKGSIYIFCGHTQFSTIVTHFNDRGMLNRMLTWIKNNPSPMNGHRFWLSGIEVGVFARKEKAKFNFKCRNTDFRYPKGSSKQHPTEKPVNLMAEFILASSDEGDVIFDPCMGSGTTGVAAIRCGRKFIGCELHPPYYDVSMGRISSELEKVSGQIDLADFG